MLSVPTCGLPLRSALLVLALVGWVGCDARSDAQGGAPQSPTAETSTPQASRLASSPGVSALGRLEPLGGLRRVGAPSMPEAVSGALVSELRVDEGDVVEAGAVLAITDASAVLEARAAELEAEVLLAQRHLAVRKDAAEGACVLAGLSSREADRFAKLLEEGVVAADLEDRASSDSVARAAACRSARVEVGVAEAAIQAAEARHRRAIAEWNRSIVRAPISGQILDVVTHEGELVGLEGVVEIGAVDQMVAVAEVYETDIGRVRKDQTATIRSPALPAALRGRVHWIRPKVEKQDLLGTDPASRKDARVIEVEILLDESETARRLSNLQVEVVIDAPGG